jgi:hypothetical protein
MSRDAIRFNHGERKETSHKGTKAQRKEKKKWIRFFLRAFVPSCGEFLTKVYAYWAIH